MKTAMALSNRFAVAGMMLWFGAMVAPPPAVAAGASGADAVRTLYDTLLANMRNGPALGVDGRYARIEPAVERVFDVPFMTRIALGPEWERLNEAQRQQVNEAFGRYIAAICAERFDSYAGEQLRVTGEKPSAGSTMVTTDIVKSDGEPVHINYLLRQNGGTWRMLTSI